MAAALGEQLTFRLLDAPGHGRSDPWNGTGDFVAVTAEAARALLPPDGPADLIGHSAGGVAAVLAALAAPERVRTLTLIDPVLFRAAEGRPGWAEHMRITAGFAERLRADPVDAARAFLSLWGEEGGLDAAGSRQKRYILDRIGLIAAGIPAVEDDIHGIFAGARLSALQMPVMIVIGGASPAVIAEIAEGIGARIPAAQIRTVAGARHMLPVTHPADVAAAIAENLSRG